MWGFLASLGTTLLGKILPDRSKANEAQSRINEAEVAGAPQSFLRLWRSFLGWSLSVILVWEIAGRMIVVPMFFPEWGKTLPPSTIDQVISLLMSMLGFGY